MNFSSTFMFLLVAFLLVNNLFMKALLFMFTMVCFLRFKVRKEEVRKKLVDIIIGSVIIFLNCLIKIRFDYVNFIFLGVFSLVAYFKFSNFKLLSFYNLYLLLIFMKGVVFFWERL